MSNDDQQTIDRSTEPQQPAGSAPAEFSSPLRFGVKAMFAVTACCGVQFALMSYLGTLWGLCIGILVCLSGFTVVMVVGIVLANGDPSRAVARLDNLAIQFTLAVVLLFVGVIFAGGGLAIYNVVSEARLKARVQRKLGVYLATDFVNKNGNHENALRVKSVSPGSIAEQSGFETGDVIVTDSPPKEYLQILDDNRGKEIDVTLAAVSGSQRIDEVPMRKVTVAIPR